jgi:hypothetical protein
MARSNERLLNARFTALYFCGSEALKRLVFQSLYIIIIAANRKEKLRR